MRKITVLNAIVALLLGSFYAPLFHVHNEGSEAVVHAHLPEPEEFDTESVVHIEPPHTSHASARSIDILTTAALIVVHFDAIIQSTALPLAEAQPSTGFAHPESPRAHAPPGLRLLIPRAPPA